MSAIVQFPRPKPSNPLGVTLALHSDATRAEHDEGLAWVRWMFQSIRIRCEAIVFETHSTERSRIIADWQGFAEQAWRHALAPMLLQAWRAAEHGDLPRLVELAAGFGAQLNERARERSAAAGELLLGATRGAKYPGVLGQLRQQVTHNGCAAHLAVVWPTVAVLFQLPPHDVLTEYLREEWLTGLREHPHPSEPQGPLSFSAMAHRALRESRMGTIYEQAIVPHSEEGIAS
ncbi:MAG: urease accessory UreF family protein [Roseimicrobium sp.]